jgi:hypothetical protein
LIEGRGTTNCRMDQGHRRMSLGMMLLQGDITQSSTHDARLTEIDCETSYNRFEMKLVRWSTKENRSIICQPITPWPRECSSIRSPDLPNDNEEVNMHVKCLQAMLDTTTVADPVHDREDGDRGQEFGHQQSSHGDSASSITPPEELHAAESKMVPRTGAR